MREGSDAPEDDEGSKDDDLEGFRKEVMENGAEGVDEESLEEWREGIVDKEDGQGAGASEAGEGEKDTDVKDEAAEKEVVKEAEAVGPQGQDETAKEEPNQDGQQEKAEPSEDKQEAAEQEKTAETLADDADEKGDDETRGQSVADAKDATPDEKAQGAEPDERPTQESDAAPQADPEKPPEPLQDKSSQIESESYDRNDNQLLVVEQAGSVHEAEEKAETPGLQHFQADVQHEEAPRVLEAVDYGKGANVRLPDGDLERAGFDPPRHNAIVQAELRTEGREEAETAFARYNASDHRAEAYVGDIGGEKGSRYALVEAKEVNEDSLVKAFEKGKCDHLDNVRLEHDGDRMFLKVDGRAAELGDYKMATSGSHLVMRGKLEEGGDCKLEFDGHRASVKFGRDYPVERMRMEKDELVVKYEQSWNEVHEHRIHLEHLAAPERPSLNQFDKPQMMEHLRVLNRPPGNEGMYQIGLDSSARDEIKSLLADALDYGMMKADISELLVPNILESLGWERIERHPFTRTRKDNAAANGTDWLMRDPDGGMVLVEMKWFENRRDAVKKAASQVEDDFRIHRNDPDRNLRAAYIAIMEFDERDGKPLKIHTLRVTTREELR